MGPDVSWDRARRESPNKAAFCEEEAHRWLEERKKHVAADTSKIRILSGYERKYW